MEASASLRDAAIVAFAAGLARPGDSGGDDGAGARAAYARAAMADDRATVFRPATRGDLEAVVALLADDVLGATRECAALPLARRYVDAFDAIVADPHQELVVGERDGEVVATLQLTCIPGIGLGGAWRGLIEAVRVASPLRGRGIGKRLIAHAVARAQERGCGVVQLTSNRQRRDAIRFYESLGFVDSHAGLKLVLAAAPAAAR